MMTCEKTNDNTNTNTLSCGNKGTVFYNELKEQQIIFSVLNKEDVVLPMLLLHIAYTDKAGTLSLLSSKLLQQNIAGYNAL